MKEDDMFEDPLPSLLNVIEGTNDPRLNSVIQEKKLVDRGGYTLNLNHTLNSRKSAWAWRFCRKCFFSCDGATSLGDF